MICEPRSKQKTRGTFRTGYTYVASDGSTAGGYLFKNLRRTWKVYLHGPDRSPRYIKRLVYPMVRRGN